MDAKPFASPFIPLPWFDTVAATTDRSPFLRFKVLGDDKGLSNAVRCYWLTKRLTLSVNIAYTGGQEDAPTQEYLSREYTTYQGGDENSIPAASTDESKWLLPHERVVGQSIPALYSAHSYSDAYLSFIAFSGGRSRNFFYLVSEKRWCMGTSISAARTLSGAWFNCKVHPNSTPEIGAGMPYIPHPNIQFTAPPIFDPPNQDCVYGMYDSYYGGAVRNPSGTIGFSLEEWKFPQ